MTKMLIKVTCYEIYIIKYYKKIILQLCPPCFHHLTSSSSLSSSALYQTLTSRPSSPKIKFVQIHKTQQQTSQAVVWSTGVTTSTSCRPHLTEGITLSKQSRALFLLRDSATAFQPYWFGDDKHVVPMW